jgi:predicted NBD/HSP70 family sugar kinase
LKKVTPEQARIHNRQLVFKTVYEHKEISRAAIARATHLTRPTVSAVVSELLAQGLVTEVGYGPSTGGKPPMLLSVEDDARHLIGVDLARGDFHGALINLRGVIRRRIDLPLNGRTGDAALALAHTLLDELVTASERPLLGVGVAAPGPVDAQRGLLLQAVNLGWRDVPLRQMLTERYGLPTYVANDCQVAALAEYTFGENESDRDLVVINVGEGIGAGLVLNGQLFYGNLFGAGEIGHLVVDKDGPRCRCGNRGCLEMVASKRALLTQASALMRDEPDSALWRFAETPDAVTLADVCAAFAADDADVRQLVRRVGRHLGEAVAALVTVLGGPRVRVAGSLDCFGTYLLEALQAELARRALPALVADTDIGPATLGEDLVLLGASALLLPNELGLF